MTKIDKTAENLLLERTCDNCLNHTTRNIEFYHSDKDDSICLLNAKLCPKEKTCLDWQSLPELNLEIKSYDIKAGPIKLNIKFSSI